VRHAFPATYGENCVLVPIDAALVPLVGGALLHFQQRGYWKTDAEYELGYNAFAELQEELMGNCIKTLQMEIRAMRGVDDLTDAIFDPDTDPFFLSLGNLADSQRELERITAKLEEIRVLMEAMANAEDLEDIKASAAQIALLLA
jgi:hypothetical protein